MNILESTQAYEHWLRRQTRLIPRDLNRKHQEMATGGFPFLRATFYRWAQIWPVCCPELAKTPSVLAVGDLHVENFGTWRDAEGRLVWGINDFDEACPMPYANDLVRLATSAVVAIREKDLAHQASRACDAILEGYTEGIRKGGKPFVLAERNLWLRDLALNKLREPARFWRKLERLQPLDKPPPANVKKALLERAPKRTTDLVLRHRQAGLGSLGRERVTLVGRWRGGLVAREAKPLVPSAWSWAQERTRGAKIWYQAILAKAVHAVDPYVTLCANWVLRRLAPDCSRIELSDLPRDREEGRLFWAMGMEAANVHRGSEATMKALKKDLARRSHRWLREAASTMVEATLKDWKEWKVYYKDHKQG